MSCHIRGDWVIDILQTQSKYRSAGAHSFLRTMIGIWAFRQRKAPIPLCSTRMGTNLDLHCRERLGIFFGADTEAARLRLLDSMQEISFGLKGIHSSSQVEMCGRITTIAGDSKIEYWPGHASQFREYGKC